MAAAPLDFYTGLSSLSIDGLPLCLICSCNDMSDDQPLCAECLQQFLQPTVDKPNPDEVKVAWQCPRCTLYNTNNHEQCNSCGKSKFTINNSERVLADTAMPSVQTTRPLTVRDRRHKDQSNAERIFQNIVEYYQESDESFVDDQFIPSERSIGSDSLGRVAQWLRISDTIPLSQTDNKLKWTMFSSPQPSDIEQGALGNCWLVAALALISEQPRLLEHILLTKEINEQGVFLVRICHNGLWETVIVDDYFPCTKHKHLVFTQAKRRQLYVPLTEKACAKIFGSYASLRSGNMREGLQLLTGAPCDYIDLKPRDDPLEEDIVWVQLLSACEAKLLIGTSSGGTDISPEEYTSVHIHRNHAFSLLTAHTLKVKPYRFVLIRDPHSRSNYVEDVITESVLQQLRAVNPTRRSSGAFWISWPKFLRYFSSITISTYNSNHYDIREQSKFTQSSTDYVTSYRIHVPQKSSVNISLLYHRHNRTTRSFHTQAFVLCDVDDISPNGCIGKRESILVGKRGGFVNWSGVLQAGYYVLIPFSTSFWRHTDKHRDFTVVILSNDHIDYTTKKKPSTFLADCLISATMKMNHKAKKDEEAAFYSTSSKLGLKIFVAENSSRTENLNVDVYMTDANNVNHSRHSHLPYNTHDCIPPRHRQLIFMIKSADRNGESYQLNYNYKRKHTNKVTEPIPQIDNFHDDLHSPRIF